LDVPDDTVLSLTLSDEAPAAEICLAASVKLYELGRLSSGAAARLAGLPRVICNTSPLQYPRQIGGLARGLGQRG